MNNEGTTRRRRGGIRLATLLASLSLAAGAQALVPAWAGAEASTGENCGEATVAIDCAFDEDNSGVTGGADTAITYVRGISPDPADYGGLPHDSDGDDSWGDDSGDSGDGGDGGVGDGGIGGSDSDNTNRPPPSGGVQKLQREIQCQKYLRDFVKATDEDEEKALLRLHILCMRYGPLTTARGDHRVPKLTARGGRHRTAVRAKKQHVGHSVRPSHLSG